MAGTSFDKEAFVGAVAGYTQHATPQESAALLQKLIRTKLLRYTDMRDAPERFFAAHRLLATQFDKGVGGFGIRFTVQFNLFAGSILGLGSDEQIADLERMQEEGVLGCFALTEAKAGVMSGLIVETTATWLPDAEQFEITTPHDGAQKNWISQGLTAELCVVMADLIVGGKRLGPHPFLIRIREQRSGAGAGAGYALCAGVEAEDMGVKTVANDLDNARLRFSGVRCGRGALLARFCEVRGREEYVVKGERMRIEVIGQRLLTGRLCIAQAALVATRKLFGRATAFARVKACNGTRGAVALAALPQLASLLAKADGALSAVERFCAAVERRLSAHLSAGSIPSDELVEAIGVAKIRSIGTCIAQSHALQQEVGSYALMGGTGFEHLDMLQCCKFAEGDSRILLQKMARDRLKRFQKEGTLSTMVGQALLGGSAAVKAEAWSAFNLGRALTGGGAPLAEAWEREWEAVYELAERVCDRHMVQAAGEGSLFEECQGEEEVNVIVTARL
jgi:acyl-CoA oxidase